MVEAQMKAFLHTDEEYDPILRKGIPLQNSFEKVDVTMDRSGRSKRSKLHSRCTVNYNNNLKKSRLSESQGYIYPVLQALG